MSRCPLYFPRSRPQSPRLFRLPEVAVIVGNSRAAASANAASIGAAIRLKIPQGQKNSSARCDHVTHTYIPSIIMQITNFMNVEARNPTNDPVAAFSARPWSFEL